MACVDVVAAYKNLQKEKEALESTVRVLSSSAAPVEPPAAGQDADGSSKDVGYKLDLVRTL